MAPDSLRVRLASESSITGDLPVMFPGIDFSDSGERIGSRVCLTNS